jgi:hypothetical protein
MTLEFNHANLKGNITLFVDQIFGTIYLTEHKCVGILGPGNAVAPVSGSLEEVTDRISKAKKQFYSELLNKKEAP